MLNKDARMGNSGYRYWIKSGWQVLAASLLPHQAALNLSLTAMSLITTIIRLPHISKELFTKGIILLFAALLLNIIIFFLFN